MGYCRSIKMYDGSKSQRLQGMIDSKLKTEYKKKLPKLIKDKLLIRLKKLHIKAKIQYEETLKRLKEREAELKLHWSKHNKKYSICSDCFIDLKVNSELQKASDLYAIGKHKEANIIWEKVIKEYKIM